MIIPASGSGAERVGLIVRERGREEEEEEEENKSFCFCVNKSWCKNINTPNIHKIAKNINNIPIYLCENKHIYILLLLLLLLLGGEWEEINRVWRMGKDVKNERERERKGEYNNQ